MTESQTGVLVMPSVVVVHDRNELRVISLSEAKNAIITPEKMQGYAMRIKTWTWPKVILFGFLASWIILILQSLYIFYSVKL